MKPGLILSVILLIAILARVGLIARGGQFYWPDETRYDVSRDLVATWARGDLVEGFRKFDSAEHFLFKIVGIVPASIEWLTGEDARIPAAFFGLASVASIALLWAIARRAGASEPEALVAAALLTLSATFFYYARHLVPYDVGMALGLLAIYVGLRPGPGREDSILCGVLACCAFLTYEGYWALAATAVLIHIANAASGLDVVVRRALFALCGLLAPPLTAVAISAVFGGRLLASFLEFSQTVNQGSFGEGWRLPFEFLWHAEHLLLVLWTVALVAAAWHLARGDASRVARLGLIGACGIYAALVVTSTVLHLFVVYGRVARQLVPFFCLIAAHELERLRTSDVRWKTVLLGGIGAATVLQAAANFREPLRQVFPSEFRQHAGLLIHGDPSRYAFMNAEHIYPRPKTDVPGSYTTIAQAKHPLEFLPYQYEGFDREQREALRSADLTMRLVEFGAAN